MNQVFLSPNVSMRGAGGGYYDYLDFLDVVAPALARIQQLMQILTSCTTAEAFHAAHEREKIRMNFSFTMSDREMRRRRGTWSRVLRGGAGNRGAPQTQRERGAHARGCRDCSRNDDKR